MKSLIIILLFSATTHASIRALNIAATGMVAQEENVSNISNNIANVNTNGFKRNRTEFEDLAYKTDINPGARSSGDSQYSVGIQYGTGSRVSGIKKNFEVGSPNITNNPFDLMIQGDGFFGIILPNSRINIRGMDHLTWTETEFLLRVKGSLFFLH